MYHDKDGKHKNSLVCCLLKCYVAKANSHWNPEYGTKVFTFLLALSATDNKAADSLSPNICAISTRHTQRLSAPKRGKPFILRTNKDIIKIIED